MLDKQLIIIKIVLNKKETLKKSLKKEFLLKDKIRKGNKRIISEIEGREGRRKIPR